MEYFTFESERFVWIGIISFMLLFFNCVMLLVMIKDKPFDDHGWVRILIFVLTFFLLYWGPFFFIYPLISWLFIPDYALSANIVTHFAANSFIFFSIYTIYLIRLKYLEFKLNRVSISSFRQPSRKKRRLFLFLLFFWVTVSIFFIINDGTRSKGIISARKYSLTQKQLIIDNAKIKLQSLKNICNLFNKNRLSINYKSDSITLIILNNDFAYIYINADLGYTFGELDDPRLNLSDAEKIMQIRCVACISETYKETGMRYGVKDPIFPGGSGIKAVIYYWNIKLVDILSNRITADTVLRGPNPPETIMDPKDNREYYGIEPDAKFRSWFLSLKYNEVN